ncbi:replication-associated recombination protein A [Cyclobacteriaceae bacterium]|nr:replication-associated recombination protein A [Cyclobacteriaceae bacterium]
MLNSTTPLAERMRPSDLDHYIGQEHLTGKDGIIRKILKNKTIPSMIFWGPPGVGKTTLANIIANEVKQAFFTLSAINAGVKDVREIIDKARRSGQAILFIDEIHRFTKSQQDALLGAVEKGIIKLIGATTENPSFEVNSALLSRCQVYTLKALTPDALLKIAKQAFNEDSILRNINFRLESTDALFQLANGDGRKLLNLIELIIEASDGDKVKINNTIVKEVAKERFVNYDKGGDMHYDVISAFIKSIRGSDPNAAVYWLARMLEGGEDIKFIARRLVISASEDIGLANPTALVIANNCFNAINVVGMPESRIILSQTTIYLATSPKSNSAYNAINQAMHLVKETGNLEVPLHLRGAYTKLNKEMGYGDGYKYAHDFPHHFVEQEYMPDVISGKRLYQEADNSKEKEIQKRMNYFWEKRY